jgi:hypothetical protein
MNELDGLAGLDQVELLRRRKLAKSRELQNALAGYEHRAYARETVQDNPLMALSLLVATPAYQLAKMGGLTNSRSAPSLSQMGQGLLGIGEGLYNRYGK